MARRTFVVDKGLLSAMYLGNVVVARPKSALRAKLLVCAIISNSMIELIID